MSPYREHIDREEPATPKPSLWNRVDAWHKRVWESEALFRWATSIAITGLMIFLVVIVVRGLAMLTWVCR